MGMTKDAVFKEIKVDIPDWLTEEQAEELLGEVKEYFQSEVLDYVAQGISPVTGQAFAKLSQDYADEEKGGQTKPNLDLNGSMMDALEANIEGETIQIGIFDDDQAVKAYGHNTGFEGHPTLEGKVPARKFIPNDKENFTKDIMKGYKELVEDFLDIAREEQEEDIG